MPKRKNSTISRPPTPRTHKKHKSHTSHKAPTHRVRAPNRPNAKNRNVTYQPVKYDISTIQAEKLVANKTITLTYPKMMRAQSQNATTLFLTPTQIKRIKKHLANHKGCTIRFSDRQRVYNLQHDYHYGTGLLTDAWNAIKTFGRQQLRTHLPAIRQHAHRGVDWVFSKAKRGAHNIVDRGFNSAQRRVQGGEGFFSDLAGSAGKAFTDAIVPAAGDALGSQIRKRFSGSGIDGTGLMPMGYHINSGY